MTAGVFPKDIEAAKQAGMNTVITKPLNGKELVNAIITVKKTGANNADNFDCR